MSSYREGRNFCKITILGKVSIKNKFREFKIHFIYILLFTFFLL